MRSVTKGSSDGDRGASTPLNLNGANNGEPPEQMELEDPLASTPLDNSAKKTSCISSNCVNRNLVALKALLFFFYGGLGIVSTWLNHSVFARRFTERDTALVYGISSLLSIATPIIFGLISDKSGHPKKVLVICLLLAGLTYPWIMAVPPSEPFHFKERLDWCRGLGRTDNSCVPYKLNCTSSHSELITNYGICSEGCTGKIIITKCRYSCTEPPQTEQSKIKGEKGESPDDYDDKHNKINIETSAQAQVQSRDLDYDQGVDLDLGPDPHVCINRHPSVKNQPLCFLFDEDMHDITIQVSDITGYKDPDDDGKCHYPLLGYSDSKKDFEQLLSCSPLLEPHCQVSCDLRWDFSEPDQWVCRNDYNQWIISFSVFLTIHTLGTMLVMSAAGLLNSAVVSMAHEHEHGDFFGCQLVYGTLGFALLTPLLAFLFQLIQNSDWKPIPWYLDYVFAYGFWLIISCLLALGLPYHAEWVPKPATIRPMLVRWSLRGTTLTFFHFLVILGCFQGMADVMGYYQIISVGGSILTIGFGASAAVIPALVFIYRVEKVIEFCGHHNILAIALVVFSLQFTGYAYLRNAEAEWSFLLRAMDTFAVVMVWATASFVTHNSAPRSLVATSQAIIVTLYCCVGRGFGCLITYLGLSIFPKEYVLKAAALCSIIAAAFFIFIHYCCLKPPPYSRKYDIDKPQSQGPSGKYKPLKLTEKNPEEEDKETDEL